MFCIVLLTCCIAGSSISVFNSVWDKRKLLPSWQDCRDNLDIVTRPTGVCTRGDQWCRCCGGCWRACWDKKRKKCQANGSITSKYNRACNKATAWGGDCDSYWGAWLNEVSDCCYSTMNKVKNDFWDQYPSKIDWLYYLY